MLPIGALLARYCRAWDPIWFYLHVTFQIIGFMFVIAGIGTGLVLSKRVRPSRFYTHRGLGITVFFLACLQVKKPKKKNPSLLLFITTQLKLPSYNFLIFYKKMLPIQNAFLCDFLFFFPHIEELIMQETHPYMFMYVCTYCMYSFVVLIFFPFSLHGFFGGTGSCSPISSQERCKTAAILELVSRMCRPHCAHFSRWKYLPWYAYGRCPTFIESRVCDHPHLGASCYSRIGVHALAPMEEIINLGCFCTRDQIRPFHIRRWCIVNWVTHTQVGLQKYFFVHNR